MVMKIDFPHVELESNKFIIDQSGQVYEYKKKWQIYPYNAFFLQDSILLPLSMKGMVYCDKINSFVQSKELINDCKIYALLKFILKTIPSFLIAKKYKQNGKKLMLKAIDILLYDSIKSSWNVSKHGLLRLRYIIDNIESNVKKYNIYMRQYRNQFQKGKAIFFPSHRFPFYGSWFGCNYTYFQKDKILLAWLCFHDVLPFPYELYLIIAKYLPATFASINNKNSV